jgi:beta-glucanase (GH16 family)
MTSQRRGAVVTILVVATSACGSNTSPMPSQPPAPPSSAHAWSDEFDGPLNATPDSARWTYDIGAGGWGNQELQTYTSAAQNAHLDGQGHLVVHVESTPSGFTSARLKTKGLFAAQFGSMEARIKLPFGQGIWPAFWMLGDSFNGANWPQCGEIDIMENIGREPGIVHGTVHGPGYSGGSGISAPFVLPSGQRFADDFHTFKIQWVPQSVSFYVDDVLYKTVTPASLPSGAQWVFDNPFFVILNVAVGGTFPGSPDSTTQFPQEMLVDYVRYQPLARASRSVHEYIGRLSFSASQPRTIR